MAKKPTTLQKRVARKIIENAHLPEPLTSGEIVESSGYGESMKKNPQVIINSDGVRQELINLGFTEENAKSVVGKILLNEEAEDRDRLKAASEVFKVHGTYAPEKSVNVNVEVKPSDPKAKALAEEYESKLKEGL